MFSTFSANLINKEENIIIQKANSLHSKYPDDITSIYNSAFIFSHKQWKVKFKKLQQLGKLQVY